MSETFDFLAELTYGGLVIYEWINIVAIFISWVNPDPHNPIIQFLNRMTLPVWNKLATKLPPSLRLFSAYITLLLIWFMEIFLPGVLRLMGGLGDGRLDFSEFLIRSAGFFLLGSGVLLQNLMIFISLLLVVWFFLTLVSPSINNPIVRTVYMLVDPFITPIQKYLPRQKIDLSPLIAAGFFFLVKMFLVGELLSFAVELARGNSIAVY